MTRLTRLEASTLAGIDFERFNGLRRHGHFPIFERAADGIAESPADGAKAYRLWDVFGLVMLEMATDDGVEGGPLPKAMVKLVGAPHPGGTQASHAVRLLRAAERSLSLVVPRILHADAEAPDMHIGTAVVAQPSPHEPNPKSEQHVGPLAEIVARFHDNPIVGRGPRVVSRLFTVNASEAWRRICARAAEHKIDLGA